MSVQGTIRKQPAETFPIGIDFKNRLGAGESIVTPTVTSKNLADQSDTTVVFLSGSPGVNGSQMTIRIVAGTDGQKHRVQFRAVTSVPNTFEEEIDVQVKEY